MCAPRAASPIRHVEPRAQALQPLRTAGGLPQRLSRVSAAMDLSRVSAAMDRLSWRDALLPAAAGVAAWAVCAAWTPHGEAELLCST